MLCFDVFGGRAILAVSGGGGKKRGKCGQTLHGHAPALVTETGIFKMHMQVACKKPHHARLPAPEVCGQRATLLEVVAANGAQPCYTACKALGQFGMCGAQCSKPLVQQGLLRRIIKIQKGHLPHVFK